MNALRSRRSTLRFLFNIIHTYTFLIKALVHRNNPILRLLALLKRLIYTEASEEGPLISKLNTPATPTSASSEAFTPTLATDPKSFLLGLALAAGEGVAANSAAYMALALGALLPLLMDVEDFLLSRCSGYVFLAPF